MSMPPDPKTSDTLAARIDALLPQTQCRRCGFDGCRPYADAIARGEADIDRCPPGGEDGVRRLAALLGRPPVALDVARGEPDEAALAVIDEAECIGCTLCLRACPTDAIIGAKGQMHAILADACTGCGLCVPPCPMDCISMQILPGGMAAYRDQADTWRQRHQLRQQRLAQEAAEKNARHQARLAAHAAAPSPTQDRKAAIHALIEQARRKHEQRLRGFETPPETTDE